MKIISIVCICATLFINFCATEDWLSHELYPCVVCLCHARSGCWIRQNCARYSIPYQYWLTAGSLTVDNDDSKTSHASYEKCIKDENCIVGTIIKYTEQSGKIDCNCDGVFDCKDRAAIHLNGINCQNPNFGSTYANRFNECAARIGVHTMLSKEGDGTCTGPEVQ